MIISITINTAAWILATIRNNPIVSEGEIKEQQVIISTSRTPNISTDTVNISIRSLQLIVRTNKPSNLVTSCSRHECIAQVHGIFHSIEVSFVHRVKIHRVDEEGN